MGAWAYHGPCFWQQQQPAAAASTNCVNTFFRFYVKRRLCLPSKPCLSCLTPATPPPHCLAAPAGKEGGGGVKGALKEAWHGIKEITPGTRVGLWVLAAVNCW